jgi:hypothetical protein
VAEVVAVVMSLAAWYRTSSWWVPHNNHLRKSRVTPVVPPVETPRTEVVR